MPKQGQRLLMRLGNSQLSNFMGEPFTLRQMEEDGAIRSFHPTLAQVVRTFLRALGPDGRNIVIKSMDDSDRARTLGICLQQATEYIELPVGDCSWLVGKFKEHGWEVFPTDASIVLEALQTEVSSRRNGSAPKLVEVEREEEPVGG